MRTFKAMTVVAAVAATAAFSTAEAGTTRIETRPFYGAVVTIEEGVRVFRPLPPTDRVIINPQGKTPLSLSFSETYENTRNYNYNYNENSDQSGGHGYYGGGLYNGDDGRGHDGKHHRPGGRGYGHKPGSHGGGGKGRH